jgi:uncharacterized membrane protein
MHPSQPAAHEPRSSTEKHNDDRFLLKAYGHEPSWQLHINANHMLQWTLMTGESWQGPTVLLEKQDKAYYFLAHTDKGTMAITLTEKACSDSMADHIYPYTVDIQLHFTPPAAMQLYQGCGNFIPFS